MRLFLLILLCVVITNGISAQGVTKNGESVGASSTFVSRNGKIGNGLVLDRNGKVYVLASINPTIVPPICYTTSPGTFTATGDGGTGSFTYQWYTTTDIIPGATNSTYSPANLSATTGFYCAITSGSYGPTNTSTTTVTVNNTLPTVTGIRPASNCGTGTLSLGATASSGTINWYNLSTGGSSLWTGDTFTTPSINTSTTYYAEATSGGCNSATRTPVLASILPQASITAGGGGSFSIGSNVTLTSGGTNNTNQYWEGPNDFFSIQQNPVLNNITSAMAGIYTVTGSSLSNVNLVTNGNFELGNTGFSSSYTNATDLHPEGTYAVVRHPNLVHDGFTDCADHTSNSGILQMVVNGATVAGVGIWTETVNVVPDSYYQFSYWVQSVVAGNPSIMQLYVNDVPIGVPYTANSATCSWKEFNYNWQSGPGITTAKLSLTNQNITPNGNDFALDDIVFQLVCKDTDTVVVTVP